MKKKSPSVPPSGPTKQQKREGTNQPKKTKIKRLLRQLSTDELNEIAIEFVNATDPRRVAELQKQYIEGFYGKKIEDLP